MEKRIEYPEEVIAVTKKGEREVRSLCEQGEFAIYEYLSPLTGKPTSPKKKLVLKSPKGRKEYFLFPTKDKRFLLAPSEAKEKTKIWAEGSVIEF
ncbi:MAG: hypothetical protein N2234_07825 [Planctomycetota bacterium]|nr:hypothetical protein [Planctomycetota bacterium]